ncbi:hypothetical protein ACC754_38895, partial [Rhizobium johnstonii]
MTSSVFFCIICIACDAFFLYFRKQMKVYPTKLKAWHLASSLQIFEFWVLKQAPFATREVNAGLPSFPDRSSSLTDGGFREPT